MMEQVYQAITAEAKRIADARLLSIAFAEIDVALAPAPTDERLRRLIAESASSLGLSYRSMPSGAGHSPKEYTTPADMANGVNVLLRSVLATDGGALKD